MTDDVNEPVYTDPADSGSTYRLSDDTWIYNWSTKGLPAGYFWQVGVRLDDGTVHFVTIALR